MELILHAAVKSEEGMIFLGKSHADCFHQSSNVGVKMSSSAKHQGFFTNKGRFVDREEAAIVAVAANQVDLKIKILFSEDLWSPTSNGQFEYDSVKGYWR